MMIDAQLRSARTQDMQACATIHNDWIDETSWMPRLHSRAEVEGHYKTAVAQDRKTLVVVSGHLVLGFATLSADQQLSALYVSRANRRRGVGRFLLDTVKREFGDRLQLWTFQANDAAQKFYGREGLFEINRTDGDNEEGLPDLLLEWRG